MTYCEKIVWLHLRKRQLGYRFLRQYSVDQFVIDFYCPELKLAVEIDGNVHEIPEQKEYDIARQNYIEEFGIGFIRIKMKSYLAIQIKRFKKLKRQLKT